ncbi:hypothetical protein CATYP_05285 [Corynebacterium atypicum]|uniref:WYL domain-containing protein n=1 Tax=Corynebacterium atypicum TaxID=191610 RepID=A0ABM5QMV3_9CORY|nr:hypothetical protein CATYP_05285 [Corynebacterium atypicum]
MAGGGPSEKTAKEDRDEDLERLINLTFALLDAERTGSGYLDSSWLRAHVAGYGGEDATARKRLNRDLRELARVGVPVEADPGGNGYRIATDRYELPPVVFTPEEITVLGLAGELGRASELGAFARSGWIKLAAAGLNRSLEESPSEFFLAANDLVRVPEKVVRLVLAGVAHGRAITFDYTKDPSSKKERRRMDPWGLVNVHDRIYLAGFDLDRQAPRVFRLLRVHDVHETTQEITHQVGERNLQEMVEKTLAMGRQIVDAQVRLAPGRGAELRERAERVGPDGVAQLTEVDREWLVRTIAGYGADAVVLAPAQVRQDVVRLLRAGRDAAGGVAESEDDADEGDR